MKLVHPQITWEEIPKHEDVVLHPVEQNYKKVLLTEWAILWLISFVVAATAIFFFEFTDKSSFFYSLIIGKNETKRYPT